MATEPTRCRWPAQGTEDIIAAARPLGVRLHVLGIGSASQDRFLSLLARETGGVSRYASPREKVDLEALELFASASAPLASGLKVEVRGSKDAVVAPEPPSRLFAGHPLLAFGQAGGAAQGKLHLDWTGAPTGGADISLAPIDDAVLAETLRLLRGARLITDAEAALGDPASTAAGRREANRADKLVEALSREYGLASRQMSLVAVIKRAGDKAGAVPHTLVVPVGMAEDTDFGACFSAKAHPAAPSFARMPRSRGSAPPDLCFCMADAAPPMPPELRRADRRKPDSSSSGPVQAQDDLMALASRMEPDGGMPGSDDEERIANSVEALATLAAAGHTESSGAFRLHVGRLAHSLRTASRSKFRRSRPS